MSKLSGESMKTKRAPPRAVAPGRAILHGFGTPVTKTTPSAMGANKRADTLLPSPKRTSPARGKMPGQQVF
jgi:hypothetical protein